MRAAVVTQNAASPYKLSTPLERDLIQMVGADVEAFENGVGRDFRLNCEKWYRQYRGFRKFADQWVAVGATDRDGVLYDAKKQWGSHLHIPLTYRTIEDGVPKAIANRPRLQYLPRRERWEANVREVGRLIDKQQDDIDIELVFQDILKAGYIYGLGIGKTLWREEYATRRMMRRRMWRPNEFRPSRLIQECTFNGPDCEDVDPFDWMWDPFGSDMRTIGWCVHRVWMSYADVMERIASGAWNTQSAKRLTPEDVRSLGSAEKFDEVWMERMAASGFSSFHHSTRGEHIHEVWEWHDGHRIITVLDRQVLVQGLDENEQPTESPCVGEIPFQVYRPTRLPKQMVGIGEPEPMEHLQRELDTLRSQRRDAATLALAAGYAYDRNAVDEEDIEFGPFAAIPVRNQDPRSAILPLQRQEPPGTSYKEEEIIRGDIDVISGAQDQWQQVSTTATEAQLMQQAVGLRIGMKSRRFEVEVVRRVARQWLKLDQRMITQDREVRLPSEGLNAQEAMQQNSWDWFMIGPGELQGEYEIIPEGGSMAAPNVQQNIQLAQVMLQLTQNPYVDPRKPLERALTLLDVKDPLEWLKRGEEPVPPKALEMLQAMGVKPDLIQYAIAEAQRLDPMLNPEQQGPQSADMPALGMAA